MRRYMLSPCCNAYVVVPVDVTTHRLVTGDGHVSKSITDKLSDLRMQSLGIAADVDEAYCSECFNDVDVVEQAGA